MEKCLISTLALLLLHLFPAKCEKPLAPALYVFGDSLVDSGNNNFLVTYAKVNYTPYGIDFPGGSTGRFTDGKTGADFLAQLLGLPMVPPYLGLSEAQKSKTLTGVNYASGSAGILRETGLALGKNLCMKEQVKMFKKTVQSYLSKNFKTQEDLSQYLSKAIFVVSVGSNDYINNYLQPQVGIYNSSLTYTAEQFGGLLVHRLKKYLTDLYNFGARKFIVYGIGSIG
ncbi:GDSL esterase/lipase 7-like [Macadamia integrifolia]|uniref:GDSL esterase/lipase 7-like n=1 Tax=Macadamia integrifolia TaxID=60698 RepID=UPI001C4E84D8|nr:GDSL esterase/lipase 7-like [Macadamia integrifolia]